MRHKIEDAGGAPSAVAWCLVSDEGDRRVGGGVKEERVVCRRYRAELISTASILWQAQWPSPIRFIFVREFMTPQNMPRIGKAQGGERDSDPISRGGKRVQSSCVLLALLILLGVSACVVHVHWWRWLGCTLFLLYRYFVPYPSIGMMGVLGDMSFDMFSSVILQAC